MGDQGENLQRPLEPGHRYFFEGCRHYTPMLSDWPGGPVAWRNPSISLPKRNDPGQFVISTSVITRRCSIWPRCTAGVYSISPMKLSVPTPSRRLCCKKRLHHGMRLGCLFPGLVEGLLRSATAPLGYRTTGRVPWCISTESRRPVSSGTLWLSLLMNRPALDGSRHAAALRRACGVGNSVAAG